MTTPLAVLERACLPALRRGRCCVSFSGGRDSSIVLAAATRVARREGLPLPIPVTNRFPHAGPTDESDWQELVVRHLGLDDWLRIDHTDALDIVGPVARQVLARHGLLWPFNAHFHVPLLEAAEGGTLLTGIGGDELFGSSRWARAASVLRLRESPRPRDLVRIALLASPRPLRRAVLARRFPEDLFPWLTAHARRELVRAWAADEASEPTQRADAHPEAAWTTLGRAWTRQPRAAGGRCRRARGPPAAVARVRRAPWRLPAAASASRTGPPRCSRCSGSCFRRSSCRAARRRASTRRSGPTTAAKFAQAWAGQGVDEAVVDPEALRAAWSAPEPDAHTYLLLQAAWLEGAKNGHLDVRRVARGARGTYAVQ